MSNELGIVGLDAGLTLLGKVYAADATQEGSNVSMTEVDSGAYKGDFSLAAVADGEYMISYETATKKYGYGFLYVRDNASVSQYEFETKAEADTRQIALIAEHDATQVDVAASEAAIIAEITSLIDSTPQDVYDLFTSGTNPDPFKVTGNSTAQELKRLRNIINRERKKR